MNCSFCGHEIQPGTGSIYVTKRGKALYFCSSKCQKNLLKLKRKPRRVRWTDEYRDEKSIRIRSMAAPTVLKKGEKEEIKKKPEKKKEKKKTKKK